MITKEECEKLEEKTVCSDCVREAHLADRIENDGEEGECSFCGETEISRITLEELADHIEAAFDTHYSRTSSEPDFYEYAMLRDKEMDYDWEREGQQTHYAIMDAANTSQEISQDVQAILSYRFFDFEEATMGLEAEFSNEAHYEEIMPRDERWQEEWDNFEKQIKTEARFFSRTAALHLGELFDGIDEMRTKDGRSLVESIGPKTNITHLYRGRVFQSEVPLKKAMKSPDLELSAPPAWAAASGRMNAKGISVFYGATTPEIALAEVRPPVGSWVALARFEVIRPLRLLDLAALGTVLERGSIFDPNYGYRLGRMMFLRTLSRRMSRPVMPDDQEMEYLPTQAIADYLSTEGQDQLDGILFPSVQVGGNGVNAVLFHKASRCEEMEIPEGTEISARTYSISEEGPEPDFSVSETVPPEEEETVDENERRRPNPFKPSLGGWNDWIDADHRERTLRIDPASLQVHEVNAVQIETQSHPVSRNRFTKRDFLF
ncbi:MAG: RES domain-containing protein [Sulfitobacter sp.]|uniref:RES domain-containing protein n=1 Tax=Sulfitobacter sp. TaxID=1903071 RepID=UPI003296F431